MREDTDLTIYKKLIIILILSLFCFSLVACGEPMTEEELSAYRQSCIHEYEICSVSQYIKVHTNSFGGVVGHNLCYAFTYIDGNGALQEEDCFQNCEYGNTKVCVGDSNKYVIDTYGETKYCLYLTEDTLKSLSMQTGG